MSVYTNVLFNSLVSTVTELLPFFIFFLKKTIERQFSVAEMNISLASATHVNNRRSLSNQISPKLSQSPSRMSPGPARWRSSGEPERACVHTGTHAVHTEQSGGSVDSAGTDSQE